MFPYTFSFLDLSASSLALILNSGHSSLLPKSITLAITQCKSSELIDGWIPQADWIDGYTDGSKKAKEKAWRRALIMADNHQYRTISLDMTVHRLAQLHLCLINSTTTHLAFSRTHTPRSWGPESDTNTHINTHTHTCLI